MGVASPRPSVRLRCIGALALCALSGCAGSQQRSRAEPPSGAVSLQEGESLASAGTESRPPAPAAHDQGCRAGADCSGLGELGEVLTEMAALAGTAPLGEGARAGGAGESTADARRAPEAEGGDTMAVTQEHCDALGRKLVELAVSKLGAMAGPMRGEAERLGQSVATQCSRDMAGQTVRRAEYDCLLEARSVGDIYGCRGR